MATVVISLWARLTTRVRSLAVAKETGGCKESGGGDRGSGEAWANFWPGNAASLRGEGERSSARVSARLPVFLSSRPRNGLVRWGGGAQRHQTRPSRETPPPLLRPRP